MTVPLYWLALCVMLELWPAIRYLALLLLVYVVGSLLVGLPLAVIVGRMFRAGRGEE